MLTTLIAWLNVFPAILACAISAAHQIEVGFQNVADATGNNAAKTGAAKLTVFEQSLQALLDGTQKVASTIPLQQLVDVGKKVLSVVVTTFNALGWFKTTPTLAAAPTPPTAQLP